MPAQLNASADLLVFTLRINAQIEKVLGKRAQRTGGVIALDKPRQRSLMLAREIYHRFRNDQYWATSAEWARLKELFDWLHEQHRLNQGRTPKAQPAAWNDDLMFASKPLPAGTFEALAGAFMRGELDDAEAVRIGPASPLVLPE